MGTVAPKAKAAARRPSPSLRGARWWWASKLQWQLGSVVGSKQARIGNRPLVHSAVVADGHWLMAPRWLNGFLAVVSEAHQSSVLDATVGVTIGVRCPELQAPLAAHLSSQSRTNSEITQAWGPSCWTNTSQARLAWLGIRHNRWRSEMIFWVGSSSSRAGILWIDDDVRDGRDDREVGPSFGSANLWMRD